MSNTTPNSENMSRLTSVDLESGHSKHTRPQTPVADVDSFRTHLTNTTE